MVDADEVGAANMILTNGARLYVDHAHPEYSAPECTDPLDAVIWDKAGERVMEAAARGATEAGGVAIGILPDEDRRRANPYLSYSLVSGIGQARNLAVACSGVGRLMAPP